MPTGNTGSLKKPLLHQTWCRVFPAVTLQKQRKPSHTVLCVVSQVLPFPHDLWLEQNWDLIVSLSVWIDVCCWALLQSHSLYLLNPAWQCLYTLSGSAEESLYLFNSCLGDSFISTYSAFNCGSGSVLTWADMDEISVRKARKSTPDWGEAAKSRSTLHDKVESGETGTVQSLHHQCLWRLHGLKLITIKKDQMDNSLLLGQICNWLWKCDSMSCYWLILKMKTQHCQAALNLVWKIRMEPQISKSSLSSAADQSTPCGGPWSSACPLLQYSHFSSESCQAASNPQCHLGYCIVELHNIVYY